MYNSSQFYRILAGLTLAFCLGLSSFVRAQYAVESIRHIPSKPLPKGVFYSLPQNGIKISILIEKTTYKKGIYGDYAAKLLGIDNYIKEEKTLYKIKHIHLSNTSYPDPEQQFYLFARGELPSLSMKPNGLLISINAPSKQEKSSFKNASCASFSESKKNVLAAFRDEHRSSVGSLGVKAPFADLNVYEKYDTTYQEEWIDSVRVLRPILTPITEAKSLEQKAGEIANLIIESKQCRANLLSGIQEVNYAPETMEFMYSQLLQTENEYMESFTGVISSAEQSYEFEMIIDTALTYPLASFSAHLGLQILPGEPLEQKPILSLRLKKLPFGGNTAAAFEQSNIDPRLPKGIHYKQPQQIEAQVVLGSEVLKSKRLFVAQWGETLSLPPLKGQMVKLDPATGALLYVGNPSSYAL